MKLGSRGVPPVICAPKGLFVEVYVTFPPRNNVLVAAIATFP